MVVLVIPDTFPIERFYKHHFLYSLIYNLLNMQWYAFIQLEIPKVIPKLRKHNRPLWKKQSTYLIKYIIYCYVFAVTPPAQRVQTLLGLDPTEQMHETHPIFSEMAELICDADGELEWHETAR